MADCPNCSAPLHGLATRCWAGGEGCGWVKGKDEPVSDGGTTHGTKLPPDSRTEKQPDDQEPRYLVLPWPLLASVNKRAGGMVGWTSVAYRKGLVAARAEVTRFVMENGWRTFAGPVRVSIDYYPPDRRRRDYHNYDKLILDAMTAKDEHPGIYLDDAQVWDWRGSKREMEPEPRAVIAVRAIQGGAT